MSKTATVILVVLVLGVFGGFGFLNYERNQKIRGEAYAEGQNMVRMVLPDGEDLDYARDVYDEVFSDAFDYAFSGGLFSAASYDERDFIRRASQLISDRAKADGRDEVARAIERYVDVDR